jgi:hypothetical protein
MRQMSDAPAKLRTGRRLARSIAGIAALFLAAALSGGTGPTPGSHSVEPSEPQGDVQPELDRFGVRVPERLYVEAMLGIDQCFLSDAATDSLSRMGLTLMRCNPEHALALGIDRIGLPAADAAPRQPLVLSIHRRNRYSNPLSHGRLLAPADLAPGIESTVRERFAIAPSRRNLRYWVLLDNAGHYFGPVVVADSNRLICEFAYPETEFPQTTCEEYDGDFVIKLETNSTNFEAARQFLSSRPSAFN